MDDNPPPLDPILFRNASAPPEILDDNAEILDDSDDEDIPQRCVRYTQQPMGVPDTRLILLQAIF